MRYVPVIGMDDYAIRWLESRLQQPDAPVFNLVRAVAVAIFENVNPPRLACVVAYNDLREGKYGNSLQVALAAEPEYRGRWATRTVLGQLLHYPFKELGVTRLWMETAKSNKVARGFAAKLGFKYEGCARKAWDGQQSSVVYSLLDDEERWSRYYKPEATYVAPQEMAHG